MQCESSWSISLLPSSSMPSDKMSCKVQRVKSPSVATAQQPGSDTHLEIVQQIDVRFDDFLQPAVVQVCAQLHHALEIQSLIAIEGDSETQASSSKRST